MFQLAVPTTGDNMLCKLILHYISQYSQQFILLKVP